MGPPCTQPGTLQPPRSLRSGSPWGGGFIRRKVEEVSGGQISPPRDWDRAPALGSWAPAVGWRAWSPSCATKKVSLEGPGTEPTLCRDPACAWVSSKDAAALVLPLGSTPAPKLSKGSHKRSKNSPAVGTLRSGQTFPEPSKGLGQARRGAGSVVLRRAGAHRQAEAGGGWFGSAGGRERESLLSTTRCG